MVWQEGRSAVEALQWTEELVSLRKPALLTSHTPFQFSHILLGVSSQLLVWPILLSSLACSWLVASAVQLNEITSKRRCILLCSPAASPSLSCSLLLCESYKPYAQQVAPLPAVTGQGHEGSMQSTVITASTTTTTARPYHSTSQNTPWTVKVFLWVFMSVCEQLCRNTQFT